MASPQNTHQTINGLSNSLNGDEVVISGISGIFPNSDSVLEFMNNLYNKIDMVTSEEPKWKRNDPDLPKHIGKIKGLDKFDSQFFGVTYHLACAMEPMGRKLLEHTYGAIFDSGTSLQTVRGKKVGVFVGSAFADNSAISFYNLRKRSDFIVNGSSRSMLANRISYWIDGKGPSYGLDYADTSSTACLEIAYKSIKSGECDAAIVGGCNYVVHPTLSLNMRRGGLLCLDGKTKCFDKNGDGYVRADAINVIFLQRARDAHRIYAEIYHAKGNYRMNPDAHFFAKGKSKDIEDFLREFYSGINVDPKKVEYVEAHGAAIAKADESELKAISNIFFDDTYVKVGSVKSNMGHSEAASGLCSITKLCLAYHKGKLPANLHYKDPQDHIPAVRDGKIRVVSEHTEFDRELTALNSFSYTGANYHVVLKGHFKPKEIGIYKSNIPYLVLASGRQELCVQKIIDLLKSHPIDPEELGLLHKAFEYEIPSHTGRGYALLDTDEQKKTVCLSESVEYYPGIKRPLWFVYSGMGSQWPAMGADLMRIPSFAASIQKCHKALEPIGIDLIRILTDPDKSIIANNVCYAFVGISAVQVALTDLLNEMGIVPDSIIGHSLGEMGCAYQDGTFTIEQIMLATYSRGLAISENKQLEGLMVAVGLGYKEVVNMCPPEIDIGCHNSSESTTLSGPADITREFVKDLNKRGVFAREVPSGGVAYHSRYIGPSGPSFFNKLKKIIPNPKKRSTKWISTSVPQDQWNEPDAMYSSAEYHCNNMLNPVLFEEMSTFIPDNAVIVEIAPHGLLQAILKRAHKKCTHVPLTRRGNPNGVQFFLEAIGKIYETGINPRVDVLYPKIEFPVSTETTLLSHYVDWEHSEIWPEFCFLEKDEVKTAAARNFVMSIHDDDYKFLEGHIREGVNVLPESAILVLIWETLSMHIGENYQRQSVVFKEIQFYGEVAIKPDIPFKVSISICRGNDIFEVSQGDIRIASGIVSAVKVLKFSNNVQKPVNDNFDEEIILLDLEDVYKILASRGYSYKGKFKTITQTNVDCNQAYIEWNKDWVTFLDSLIQLNIIAHDYDGISIPKFIRQIKISVFEQDIFKTEEVNGKNCLQAEFNKYTGITRCGGVEINNIIFTDKPVVEKQPDILLTRSFYPHYSMNKIDLKTALRINLQIVAENIIMNDIKIKQIVTSNKNINSIIKEISQSIPNVNIDVDSEFNVSENYEALLTQNIGTQKANVFIIENILDNEKKLKSLRNIPKDCFVLALETGVPKVEGIAKQYFSVVSAMSDGKQILMLLRRQNFADVTYVRVNCDNKLDWVSRVYDELNKTKRVVLLSERQPYCGALGFVRKLRMDGEDKIALISTGEFSAPAFHPEHALYREQLEKSLAVNILKKGEWGGYYYVPATTKIKLQNATLTSTAPGDLENLTWIEGETIPSSENLVQVAYAGISLKDIKKAINSDNKKETSLGMDYSGINSDGERVMGLISSGALSSTVQADPCLLWPVPQHWTLQDAATVPLPYAMAYYCLSIRSSLVKGQSVLVTSGALALGQALISLCLSMECTVFVTVGNEYKKKMLLSIFPQLDEHRIGFSRNDSFLSMVKSQTEGKGCDFVINQASGPLRECAMKCTGLCGFFLDLSSYDMSENKDIGMGFLQLDRSYKAINFSCVFNAESTDSKKDIHCMLSEGIAKGVVKPITHVEYLPTEISRAFRFLSSSKHVGKVLIKMRSPEIMSQGFQVTPRMNYCSKGVYIVICDENGLGIELADRLIKRGVRKLILHLKSKVNGYLQTKFISWQKYGVSIKISSNKIETQDGCTKLIKEATSIGSVKGIFILQVPENDKNAQDFVQKFNKAIAVINLDLVSRNYCKELSQFVVLTTPSPHASEEFTTSLTENICLTRSELGAPALVVHAEGLVAHQNGDGYSAQALSEFFNAMEIGLKLKYNNIVTLGLNRDQTSEYLDKLQKILDVSNMANIDKKAIVADLYLNENNLEELRILIKNVHQINYPVEKIRRLTVESLTSIGSQTTSNVPREGLGAFYANIDDEEEHMATSHPIVAMNTLLYNGSDDDLNPSDTYVVLIPGFEGRYQIFETVAERLKVQAVAVQLACDIEGNSIPEMAATVRRFMNTKFQSKTKFYLLGYSFGVNIALELAALLEKEGHTGVVFCLDSSPDALKIQLNSYIGDETDSILQNTVLEHMYGLMTGNKTENLKSELENTVSWPNKVDVCMKNMTGLAGYSNEYKKHILESAYNRILLAKEYQPDFELESELVLIKGLSHPKADNLTKDYNLSKYTRNPVKVFRINSDHPSAPYDCRVSNIVNKLLDKQLVEDFQNKNLCDSYKVESN